MNASDTTNEELSINDGVVRLLAEFIRDRDAAQAELSKVTADRDEARASVDTISRQRNQSETERDVARAELASMDVAVAWRERWQPVIDAACELTGEIEHQTKANSPQRQTHLFQATSAAWRVTSVELLRTRREWGAGSGGYRTARHRPNT